jgi:hypothetical protein
VLYPIVIGTSSHNDLVSITDNSITGLVKPDGTHDSLSTYMIDNEYNAITFDSSITSIADTAFKTCTILLDSTIATPITFEGSDLSIGVEAFRNCRGITQINLSNSSNKTFTSIGNSAFMACTYLTGFATSGVIIKAIGTNAFISCQSLTETGINNITTMPTGFVSMKDAGIYTL